MGDASVLRHAKYLLCSLFDIIIDISYIREAVILFFIAGGLRVRFHNTQIERDHFQLFFFLKKEQLKKKKERINGPHFSQSTFSNMLEASMILKGSSLLNCFQEYH